MKVFVVDDEPSIRFFFKKVLKINGFDLIGSATNGQQAVNMFKTFKEKPDVILMDHRMPIKNGLNTSKEILQIDPNIKIIIISADKTIKEEAFSIGVVDFLDKPFTINMLISSIKKCLK
jgi:two-component system chemotaxis response regulator CheY